jgi:internalin A
MQKIGEGDRVFIFLSEKYLHSPYGVFELFEMWRNSRENKSEFLRRVRFFTIDGAKIAEPDEWLEYTDYWKQKRDKLRGAINRVGWEEAGEEAIKRFWLMDKFAGKISDVLALFADVVQPRSFEDFLKYGFDEPPVGKSGR